MSVDAPETDRQADGRFKPGNAGNPNGNPRNRASHWAALSNEATTDEDCRAVWKAVTDAARCGDMKAADIFLERLAGKVPQAMEHSGPEGGGIVIQYALAQKPADG